MENNEPGIKEILQEIHKELKVKNEDEEIPEKERKFKLPWKGKVGKAKVKKGWATIAIIRNNGNIDFVKRQIRDGTVEVEGFPRVGTIDYKLSYKGKPFFIIPEWSMKPFSPVDNYSETVKERMNIAGRRAVLATLETEKIKPKKDMGNMIWIILGLVVIGGIWYLGKNAGWF